ncbi:CRISPR-associated endonuclease Cas2 [Geobacter pickeringii]|uniref:CRISPR-associated endoribonuclease Cas2 n=1 Tax=Geobacter pickeringii TaxID=345632 RepID=A0A0B5BIB7_9BACT|nr:CRISPR-associated endonuclease Cas2 [Geobacter pickeringii]AJE03786.1 CRISPR-associated protein Cas2 [Geobacter pickeringii]
MWIIVAYDVNTETKAGRRRLRRVAQVCKNFGQRVQKSVFECQVSEMKFEELRRKLLKEIKREEDNLRLYRLTEPRDDHVETYGLTRTIFFDDEPLIV